MKKSSKEKTTLKDMKIDKIFLFTYELNIDVLILESCKFWQDNEI
jgi:hypothetical protein